MPMMGGPGGILSALLNDMASGGPMGMPMGKSGQHIKITKKTIVDGKEHTETKEMDLDDDHDDEIPPEILEMMRMTSSLLGGGMMGGGLMGAPMGFGPPMMRIKTVDNTPR
jgi:hypothetical protein